MFTIFNRKELISTFSMKAQSEISRKLQTKGIKYKCKVVNRNSASAFSSSRARTGTLGQNVDRTYQYVFYVYKKDYDRARRAVL